MKVRYPNIKFDRLNYIFIFALIFRLVLDPAFGGSEALVGCQRIKLILDPRVTSEILDREWGTGTRSAREPASLELLDCRGHVVDRLKLQSSLATLDPTLVRGARFPTVLVTEDLTAPAGTYSGPLTLPIQLGQDRLEIASAAQQGKPRHIISLSLTGKSAWKKISVGPVDDLLWVNCQPLGDKFTTFYHRYHPTPEGWQERVRSDPGFWESDQDFPGLENFP